MTPTLSAILWVLGGTAAVFLLLRFRAPQWCLLAVALIPSLALSADLARRTVAVHGMMHLSFVYEILERGAPPENPLLGGEPLRYPWGHHLAVATAARLGVPPGLSFAISHLLALLLFCVALDRAASLLDRDRAYRVFAVALALFGTAPFVRPPLAAMASGFGLPLEGRVIPWLKFFGVNSNSIGLAFSALALFGLLGIVTGGFSRPRRAQAALAAAVLGSGLFYPMSFVSIGLWCAAAFVWLAASKDTRPAAVRLAVAAALGALPVLPYLWLVSHGRAAGGSLQEPPTGTYVLRHFLTAVTVLILPAALALLRMRSTVAWLRARPRATVLLVLCMAIALAVFVLGFIRPLVAYKILLSALLPLGLLAAVPLRDLQSRLPAAAVAVFALFVLPAGWLAGTSLLQGWQVVDPLVDRGGLVEPLDPAERDLTAWIARQTPKDALFIDRRRTIPPFGRRQLFVALPEPALPGRRDGWGMPSELLLGEVTGADPERAARRRQIAESLLSPDSPTPVAPVLAELDGEARGRAVYVVAREKQTAARLSWAAGLRSVWKGPAVEVFLRVTE